MLGSIGDSIFGKSIAEIEAHFRETDSQPDMFPGAAWVATGIRYTPSQVTQVQEGILRGMKARGWSIAQIRMGELGGLSWNPLTGIFGAGETAGGNYIALKVFRPDASVNPALARRDLGAVAAGETDLVAGYSQEAGEQASIAVDDAAKVVRSGLDKAADFATAALPWWAWVALALIAAGIVAPYVRAAVAAREATR